MELELYFTRRRTPREIARRFQMFVSLVVVTVLMAMTAETRIVWVLVAALVVGFVIAPLRMRQGVPVFWADRTGFRIKGGRLRPWEDYAGVSVQTSATLFGPSTHTVRVRLQSGVTFRQRSLATMDAMGEADEMAQKIMAFKRELDEVWAREAERFDLGPAPVVAARAEAARRRAREKWRPLDRLFGWASRG